MSKQVQSINYSPTLEFYSIALIMLMVALIILVFPDLGLCGTGGTEFNSAETKLSDMISGGLGKIITVTSLGFALIGSVLKFNPIAIAGSLGVGLASSLGVGIVTSGITALI